MQITFHGAAREVTGSCHHIFHNGVNILFDCGMFQGNSTSNRKNRARFKFPVRKLDAVVISHAHIDHIGRLPRLIHQGYSGPIYATPPTIALAEILLKDSAHLQQQSARRESRRRKRQGRDPVKPLYTSDDVEKVLPLFEPVPYGKDTPIGDEIIFRYHDAGHILGSAITEFEIGRAGAMRRLIMSGDLGNTGMALVRDPARLEHAHAVVMESTYGDRDHRSMSDSIDELADVLAQAARDHGMVLIPAFAVGRTQGLLYHLAQFDRDGRLPIKSVYLDSPMAITTTNLYCRHTKLLDKETLDFVEEGFRLCNLPFVRFVENVNESIALNDSNEPAIIIAASGMCTGGRIAHHLKHHVWKKSTHVVIVGYQGRGTTGRALVDGAPAIRVYGEKIAVNATIHTVGGFSAHAGRSELLAWHAAINKNNPVTMLVHGEDDSMEALADSIDKHRHKRPLSPKPGQTINLDSLI